MARMLKCPRCKHQSAYQSMGWAEDGRHFEQKRCNCGYEGQRRYMSLEMSNRLRKQLAKLYK